MLENASITYTFTEFDYDSSMPKFISAGEDFPRNLRFATKIIPLKLNSTKHSVITITVHPSDNVDYGCVAFTQPNGITTSVSSDKNGLYIPSNTALMNVNVFMKDGVRGITTYYIIVNADPTQTSDILLINIGLGQYTGKNSISTVSLTYGCPVEVYSYNMGLHVYSPYDSIYYPKLRTILYSFTQISEWQYDTLVYCSPGFNNPALPYYYGYMDKVYKVGGLINRAFGTIIYYKTVQKRIITWGGVFNTTKTTQLTDGPRSHYDSAEDESPACVIPTISGVGKIKEIILKTTLIQPLSYRYYLGFSDKSRQDSSDSTFTAYRYNTDKHYPIIGSLHALIKLGSGIINGYDFKETDWRKIITFQGMAGLMNWKGTGTNFAATGVAIGAIGLVADVLITGAGWSLWVCKCGAKYTALFGKAYLIPFAAVSVLVIAAVILIVVLLVQFFKKTITISTEPCKVFLHMFSSTPYIEIGNKLLNKTNSPQSSGLYFCDGIYYYSQKYDGTVISKTECTGLFFDYEEDINKPITYSTQSSIIPDKPELVDDWASLIVLPYTSGKPEPVCNGTIYYNTLLEKDVPNNCCKLEICKATKITIPAKTEFSCISQSDANNKATILLDSSYVYAVNHGNNSEPIPNIYIGMLDSKFTHSSWVEGGTSEIPGVISEYTTLYFDNRDTLGLTVGKSVYFDDSGCQKALKGFYTGAPYGGTEDGNASTILINQPIKTYQVESGKIKSINVETITSSLYPSYISNWFLADISINTLNLTKPLMDGFRTFDPTTLENNIKCYQGLIKKSSKDDYSVVKDFLILSGGTYVPAPEGSYLPLIDWIRHSPFYYSKLLPIVLNISENCDNSAVRGFYITGVNKITNTITPLFNLVTLEVIVKSSNGKTKTYSATTSASLDKTLIPYGTFFTSSDIISEIIISRIITQSPLNNVSYSIGNTYLCPSVGVRVIPCGGSFIPKTTLGLGYYEMFTDIGETIGTTSIEFNAGETPDRFQIYWDGRLVCDSLFVGNSLYSNSRQYYVDEIIKTKTLNRYILQNNEWKQYITPIINVSYTLNDIASNGVRLSNVSTPTPQLGVDKYYGSNICEGRIKLQFSKTKTFPTTIRVVAISPVGNFNWNIDKLNCDTPPTVLKFNKRMKDDGVTLYSNNKFGFVFDDSRDGFSLSKCGEYSQTWYKTRRATLEIKSQTGGIPIKLTIYKNNMFYASVNSTTQENSWATGGVLFEYTQECAVVTDVYTFGIEYSQPMIYEARVKLFMFYEWGDFQGRLRSDYFTNYLTGEIEVYTPPVTQLCARPNVQIGRQLWTSCNLDVETYSDGTLIPNVTDMAEWSGLTTGAWCYYKNSEMTGNTYGRLYNWYAMMGIHDVESKTDISKRKKIAPDGYHVPSIQEWDYLIMLVTNRWSDEFQYNELLLDSARRDAGTRLKSKGHVESGDGLWCWCGYEDRTAGISDDGYKFSALPGGYRSAPAPTDLGSYTIGYDGAIGRYGTWWTSSLSTQYIDSPVHKSMWVEGRGAYTSTSRRQDGRSIRLIRD